jgi:hypothetical protein
MCVLFTGDEGELGYITGEPAETGHKQWVQNLYILTQNSKYLVWWHWPQQEVRRSDFSQHSSIAFERVWSLELGGDNGRNKIVHLLLCNLWILNYIKLYTAKQEFSWLVYLHRQDLLMFHRYSTQCSRLIFTLLFFAWKLDQIRTEMQP